MVVEYESFCTIMRFCDLSRLNQQLDFWKEVAEIEKLLDLESNPDSTIPFLCDLGKVVCLSESAQLQGQLKFNLNGFQHYWKWNNLQISRLQVIVYV